jgi:hypothetical protein
MNECTSGYTNEYYLQKTPAIYTDDNNQFSRLTRTEDETGGATTSC